MNKQAQILFITIWILVVLTLLAVGTGHRVSMALRMSGFQRDKIKAVYLCKAGINRAITELSNDKTPDYDSLSDNWADNEEAFSRVSFGADTGESASVGYAVTIDSGNKQIVFGVRDEERKININTASGDLIFCLLDELGIPDAQKAANNILAYRGEQNQNIPEESRNYQGLGYECKNAKFKNIEELKLVKDITDETYEDSKGLFTVYGDGLVNVNTASPFVLKVFLRSIAENLSIPGAFAGSLLEKIITQRNKSGYFISKTDIAGNISLTGDEETNIFNDFVNRISFKSNYFSIEAFANVSKIESRVSVVYDRQDKRTVYRHED